MFTRLRDSALLIGLLGLAGCTPGNDFDFYVLALSWSPAFCAAEGADASPSQCTANEDYRLIVHGLWPQFENGWPEYCDSSEPDFVPSSIVNETFDIMPSAGLVGHQWRKHGSCTNLSHEDYFSTLRSAWNRIEIPRPFNDLRSSIDISPEDAAEAFMTANPGLVSDGIAIICNEGYLREIRLCLTTDLEFRSCPEVAARSCTLPRTELIAP